MFDIFNNVKELTLVFQNGKLVHANETALHYFNSYSVSLISKDLSQFINAKDLRAVNRRLENSRQFKMMVDMCGNGLMECTFKIIDDNDGGKFLLVQSVSELVSPERIYDNAIKIATPKTLYDPLLLGKSKIYNYEIGTSTSEIITFVQKLLDTKEVKANSTLRETAEAIKNTTEILHEKTRNILDDYASVESKYSITKSVFNINEAILEIVKRIKKYFSIEDIEIEIDFSTREQNMFVTGDYALLVKCIAGLICISAHAIFTSDRNGRIILSTKSEEGYVIIKLMDNSIGPNDDMINKLKDEKLDISDYYDSPEERSIIDFHTINSYINLNGGDMYIKREQQKGTIAIVRLPLAKERYAFCESKQEADIDIVVSMELYELKERLKG